MVRIVVALSFLAAIWFIVGDQERRSAVGSLGLGGFSALFGLAAGGSILIAGSWSAVAGIHTGTRSALVEYIIYQPAKYLPGGIAQGMLQVSHVRGALGSWARSSAVFVVHMAVLATAGVAVSSPAVFSRFGVLAGVLAGLAAVAGGLLFLRVRARTAFSSEILPPIARLAVALLMASGGLALWGVGYSLAIADLGGGASSLAAVSHFGAGWLAGFLALPIPAGIGVREATLVVFSDATISSVVAASFLVRLAVAAAEFLLALLALLIGRRSQAHHLS